MKRILSVLILIACFACVFSIPVSASSKTKNLNLILEKEGRGKVMICSIPYYGKWRKSNYDMYSYEAFLKTSKGNEIGIVIGWSEENPKAGLVIKYLSNKKYKKKLNKYLEEYVDDPQIDLSSVFTLKKDGNGRYLLTEDMGSRFSVHRVLDNTHIMEYTFQSANGNVSKSVKKKLIAYAKQSAIESKIVGVDSNDDTGNDTDTDTDIDTDIDTTGIELDPDRLVFKSEYSNMAWEFQKRGMYVLGDGRIYSYDYKDISGKIKGELTDQNILAYLKKSDPTARLDKNYLLKMCAYAMKIDPDAKYTTEYVMCDYGQNTLIYYDEEGKKVLCSCDGDERYIFNDENNGKVKKLWDELHKYCK